MKIWQELFSWERALNFDISVCWRNQKIKNLFFIQYKESMDRIDFHNRSNLINSNTRWVMREAIWQNYVGNIFLPTLNNTNWGMGFFFFFRNRLASFGFTCIQFRVCLGDIIFWNCSFLRYDARKTKTRVSKKKMSEEKQRVFLQFFTFYYYYGRIFFVQQ